MPCLFKYAKNSYKYILLKGELRSRAVCFPFLGCGCSLRFRDASSIFKLEADKSMYWEVESENRYKPLYHPIPGCNEYGLYT